jgi:hypothetical protein
MSFNYERNQQAENLLHDHRILMYQAYGERFDDVPQWMHFRVDKFYNKAHKAISNLLDTIVQVRNTDYGEYKDDIAEMKKSTLIEESRGKILDVIREEFNEVNQNVIDMNHKVMEVTNYHDKDGKVKLQDALIYQEIRTHLNGLSLKNRQAVIDKAFTEGKMDVIKAVGHSPVDLIDPDKLLKMRQDFAMKNDRKLGNAYNDAKAMAKKIREKGGSINATCVTILQEEGLDDPVTAKQHFAVFQPEDSHSAWCAQRLINEDERRNATKTPFTIRDKS